jgi:hypothetical protein
MCAPARFLLPWRVRTGVFAQVSRGVHKQAAAGFYGAGFVSGRAISCALVALVAAALVGCGGGSDGQRASNAGPLPSHQVGGTKGYLDRTTLQQHLGNAFRDGLYRLAVMSQPSERAVDEGQHLPAGSLSTIRCAPRGAEPGAEAQWPWRCVVDWRTVAGATKTTRYDVQIGADSCYAATAQPQYPAVADSTIGAPSEHPLNVFGRGLGKC